jgi:type IV pilus assembly protein PilC
MGAFLQWLWSPVWLNFFDHMRATRALMLLRLLQVAVERGTPAVPLLEVLADEVGFLWRGRLQRYVSLLAGGATLRDAFEGVPGLVPRDVLVSLRVGFDLGRPDLALQTAVAQLARRIEPVRRLRGGTIGYALFVAVVASSVLGYVSVWIIPRFRAIFAGFGLEFPGATSMIVESGGRMASLIIAIAIPAALAMVVLVGMLSEVYGWGIFWSPATWLALIWPRMRAPLVLRSLALGVTAGHPLERALESMTSQAHERALRQRLGGVCDAMNHGEESLEALYRARLLSRRDLALLRSARRAGNLGWALGALAELLERRMTYRSQLFHEWTRPLIYIPLVVPIGLVVIGIYLPLIELIKKFS